MGIVDDAVKEQIRAAADLNMVAGALTRLKPAGAGRLKGLCPLHDEKTPSFTVNTASGLWHCFGCGDGGDVFSLVMKTSGATFPEALRLLADQFGVAVPETRDDPAAAARAAATREARDVMDRAAGWFARWLRAKDPAAARARAWLTERGFTPQHAAEWGIGFAPPTGSALARALGGDIPETVLALTGPLLTSRRGQLADRLVNRLVWPIRDGRGRLAGFAGRVLPGVDGAVPAGVGKYVNPHDSAIYQKSGLLFGLARCRTQILRQHRVVVCEGYTDVMAFHAAGVDTAVATCGTAFTDRHALELLRLIGDDGEIVTAFDPDRAGWEATWRTFLAIQKAGGAKHTVVQLPDNTDPCDLWASGGGEALAGALERRQPVLQTALQRIADRHDLTDPEQAAAAARESTSLLRQVTDPALRDGYRRRAAHMLQVPAAAVAPGQAGTVARDSGGSRPSVLAPFTTPQLALMAKVIGDPQTRARVASAEPALRWRLPAPLQQVWDAAVAAQVDGPVWQHLADIGGDVARLVTALAAWVVPDGGSIERDLLAIKVSYLDGQMRQLRAALNELPPTDVEAVSGVSSALTEILAERRAAARGLAAFG